jgi:hypothetical protein
VRGGGGGGGAGPSHGQSKGVKRSGDGLENPVPKK